MVFAHFTLELEHRIKNLISHLVPNKHGCDSSDHTAGLKSSFPCCAKTSDCIGLKKSVTLGARGFFLVGGDRIERRSREGESRNGERKPLVATDNNLTSIPMPISFD